MSKTNKQDVVEIFGKLKKTLSSKPTVRKMYDDIRMMKFQIRPISGDISLLKLKNRQLIEVLWSLGKLDEVFHKEYEKLERGQKEVFFRIFDNLHWQLQDQLNKIEVSAEVKSPWPQVLEMEIFKEASARKKAN